MERDLVQMMNAGEIYVMCGRPFQVPTGQRTLCGECFAMAEKYGTEQPEPTDGTRRYCDSIVFGDRR